jgi:hypothetical protein
MATKAHPPEESPRAFELNRRVPFLVRFALFLVGPLNGCLDHHAKLCRAEAAPFRAGEKGRCAALPTATLPRTGTWQGRPSG